MQYNGLGLLQSHIQTSSTIGNWDTNWSNYLGLTDCMTRAVRIERSTYGSVRGLGVRLPITYSTIAFAFFILIVQCYH